MCDADEAVLGRGGRGRAERADEQADGGQQNGRQAAPISQERPWPTGASMAWVAGFCAGVEPVVAPGRGGIGS